MKLVQGEKKKRKFKNQTHIFNWQIFVSSNNKMSYFCHMVIEDEFQQRNEGVNLQIRKIFECVWFFLDCQLLFIGFSKSAIYIELQGEREHGRKCL